MTEAAQKETTAQGKVSETGVPFLLVIFFALFCAGAWAGICLGSARSCHEILTARHGRLQGLIERAMGQVPTHLCVVVFAQQNQKKGRRAGRR
eukprot:COSAG01_NODE_7387_length_3228_cov_17.737935_2_plen_93_part_00